MEIRKQMGFDCIDLIKKKIPKEITPEEYYIKLMELDSKYPMPGHDPPLSTEKLQNYRAYKLQPLNFKEAAEMYIRFNQRDKGITKPIDRKMISAGDYPEEWDAESV